jgi:glycosyltransferase involved in cell wall biosynthesis
MNPKVLLDRAFLGQAHDEKSARGAERVARHLFDGLRASGRCELSFVATSHLAGAYDFLVARGIPPQEKLRFSPAQLQSSRLARQLAGIVQRSIENRSLPARAGRRVLAQAVRMCNAGEIRLTSDMLNHADIYHSTLTPFPQAVRENTRLRKFINLHDFIPLKHPEYYSGDVRPFMDGVLACLTPENFAFCISEETRNDALNFSRIPPERVFVTPLAADEKIFHPVTDPQQIAAARVQCGIPDGPYFLALSAHDRHKNFVHLIHCFGALVESGELNDSNLVIVGPNRGRNHEVLNSLAKYPRAKPRIIVAGYVPDDDLAAIYSGATAFLFPSLAEGFGLPPLEAMQCGTPVIASNTTSIPEVVGDAGILLPPTEQDVWCQAMLRISRDAALRKELRQKSLPRARLFSWQRFIDEILRGYQKSMEMN